MLAQLGEHLGDNQEVGSSSLPQITKMLKNQGLQIVYSLVFCYFYVFNHFLIQIHRITSVLYCYPRGGFTMDDSRIKEGDIRVFLLHQKTDFGAAENDAFCPL